MTCVVIFDHWVCQPCPVAPWACRVYSIALFRSHVLGQLTFEVFYLLSGHRVGSMESVSYTRWSFRASNKPSVSLLSSRTPRTRLLSHIPPSATASPGATLWEVVLSRVATRKLFIEWGPRLYFYVKYKTPHTSEIYGFILSNLICLGNFYISFKRDYVSWNKNSPAHVH